MQTARSTFRNVSRRPMLLPRWRSAMRASQRSKRRSSACARQQVRLRLFPRGLHWVFYILRGGELDIPEFAIHLLDPAQIDIVNDIARLRNDCHRPAWAPTTKTNGTRLGCSIPLGHVAGRVERSGRYATSILLLQLFDEASRGAYDFLSRAFLYAPGHSVA